MRFGKAWIALMAWYAWTKYILNLLYDLNLQKGAASQHLRRAIGDGELFRPIVLSVWDVKIDKTWIRTKETNVQRSVIERFNHSATLSFWKSSLKTNYIPPPLWHVMRSLVITGDPLWVIVIQIGGNLKVVPWTGDTHGPNQTGVETKKRSKPIGNKNDKGLDSNRRILGWYR
jgi:hypothetical protein